MEIIKLTSEELNLYASDFWHTSEWLDYCINSDFDKGIDCTIALYENKKIQGIIPLIKEGQSFTFQKSYCPCGLLEDQGYLSKISNILINYAKENDIKRIAIEGYIPGFKQNIISMCIADLESKINIRKSYKSLINRANEILDFKIINSFNNFEIIEDNVNTIKQMYFSIAKKVTRPEITFEKYKEWIIKGYASLFLAILNDKIIGFTLITHYKNEAYYFLCGIVEEYKNLNVSHYLQYIIIEQLKMTGVRNYVLGDITNLYLNNNNDDNMNKKERDIAFFKAGFGNPFKYKVVSEYIL